MTGLEMILVRSLISPARYYIDLLNETIKNCGRCTTELHKVILEIKLFTKTDNLIRYTNRIELNIFAIYILSNDTQVKFIALSELQ